VAINCRLFPINTLAEEGVTAREDKEGGATVRTVVPEIGLSEIGLSEIGLPPLPKEALIRLVPVAAPITCPDGDMTAFELFDELQVTALEMSCVEPSE